MTTLRHFQAAEVSRAISVAEHRAARAHIVSGFRQTLSRDPNTSEAQILAGIALLETGYGKGWTGAGIGSHNMGAITAGSSWKSATFEYRDSKPDPNNPGKDIWYVTKFRKYPSAVEGFADLVRVAYVTNGRLEAVLPHATAGDVYGVSAGLYATVYYTGKAIYPTPAARIQAHFSTLMHHVQNVARALGEKLPDGSDPLPPTIRFGSEGPYVEQWQIILGMVVTGDFDADTVVRTKAWQRARGLKDDGIVGSLTWAKARETTAGPPLIRVGSSGSFVREWQKIMGDVVVDEFGGLTEQATKAWQLAHGLQDDGVVGPLTWARAKEIGGG